MSILKAKATTDVQAGDAVMWVKPRWWEFWKPLKVAKTPPGGRVDARVERFIEENGRVLVRVDTGAK